jgi:hypothetical protein
VRGQNNKREIRPGRLLCDPIKEQPEIGADEAFFGDQGCTGTSGQFPLQFVNVEAGLA